MVRTLTPPAVLPEENVAAVQQQNTMSAMAVGSSGGEYSKERQAGNAAW